MRFRPGAITVGILSLVLAACGSATSASTLSSHGAWSRPTPVGADNGVVYLTVTSDIADQISGAKVPAAIAQRAELHTTMTDSQAAGHHGNTIGGTMTMAEVDSLPIAAGESIDFAPGGNHIMLVDVAQPLELGTTFTLTLTLASGRTLDTDVIVTNNPPD
jgi:copper(I)-binding protein